MNDTTLNTITAWVSAHRGLTVAAAIALGALIVSVVAARIWASYRGRTLSTRASAGFAVVQAGVAYVTITGVYEFWTHRVGMPGVESAGVALVIEAVTWAAVADIFVHGETPGSVGTGRSGPLFWMAVVGGGLMAVIGSPTIAVALGRAVVVALGANMWYVRIRQKTRARAGQGRWANPLKDFALRRGWMIPADTDITHTSREWQVRTLTRAISKAAKPGRLHTLTRWAGERTIRRVMESGDAAMIRAARDRYALQYVLRTEIAPDSRSMITAVDAARDALNPPPPAPPAPAEEPAAPAVVVDAPAPTPLPEVRTATRTRRPPARRTAAASTARQDPAAAAELKERATAEAITAIEAGETLTSAAWGARFDMGEEWGRQRLAAARAQLSGAPSLNGSPVS